MFKFTGKRPKGLGVTGGKLAVCAAKPNSVSSQADTADKVHYIAPLDARGDAAR